MTITNKNGFLINATGQVVGLEIAISDCKVTGLPRLAYHKGLYKNQALELIQQIGIRTLTADGTRAIADTIIDTVTDPRRLNAEQEKWKDGEMTATTEGAFVDPKTSASVAVGTEGAISQLLFMQQLTPKMLRAAGMPIDTTTSVLHIEYLMILAEIQKLDAQGRL